MSEKNLPQSHCLSFQQVPHTTRLFLDYLYHFDHVRQFFSRAPFTRDWLNDEVSRLHYDTARRERVAAILERQNRVWGASQETLDNIARFRAGASAVVTGQQVALFGGPLFSIYKALTAIRLATEFTHAGQECVSIFWLATEDHDFEEVNHTTLLAPDGSLLPFATEARGVDDAPVSAIRFGPEIEARAEEAARLLSDSEVAGFLRQSYRAGETLGDAFAGLFSRLFQHSGVILIDASDAELHGIAESVYRAAVVAAGDLDQALLDRNRELENAGYHAQVKVTSSSTLLFSLQDGSRVPVHRADNHFTIAGEKLHEQELLKRITERPAEFSANVLLRPVVEDYLLPTVAYVGGPAEIAYFAQAAVVYEELLGRVTPILPRLSATLVEPRIQRLLERYKLSPVDAFRDPEHLRVLIAERALPGDINASFDTAAGQVTSSMASIRASLERLDSTLVEAAEHAGSKIRYQLDRLRERAARAQLRRSEETAAHAASLGNSLFPEKEPQERVIGAMSFLGRYGMQLLLTLYDAAKTGCPDHQVVYL
ncbi:MAG TPA: bacillithiol biosynthesis cysteine-adding enzyme BshC [Terriglobales bacterium]|nr:bacillithiol biosynthesis cysteine-adding enzyme BshC [Terriglobales bacterium]